MIGPRNFMDGPIESSYSYVYVDQKCKTVEKKRL